MMNYMRLSEKYCLNFQTLEYEYWKVIFYLKILKLVMSESEMLFG